MPTKLGTYATYAKYLTWISREYIHTHIYIYTYATYEVTNKKTFNRSTVQIFSHISLNKNGSHIPNIVHMTNMGIQTQHFLHINVMHTTKTSISRYCQLCHRYKYAQYLMCISRGCMCIYVPHIKQAHEKLSCTKW